MVIKGYRVVPLLKKTAKEIMADNVLGLAAQTAYYFFFSLFPLFLFVAPMLGLLGDKQKMFGTIMTQLSGSVPADAFRMIQGVVKDVVFSPSAPGVMSVGALLAAWAGSNIFSALIDALNSAYNVKETRPYWKTKLIALGAVIGSGLILLSATAIFLGGEDIVNAVATRIGIGETGRIIWTIVQIPIAVALLVGLAWCVYWFLPNLTQGKKHVLVGAMVATVLWIVVTILFRLYVQHFGSYNKTYGAIGGVVVLLTWMYLSMLVVLIGGELNSELHHGTGALDPRKGATIQGRLATAGAGRSSNDRVSRVEPLAARRSE